MNSQAGNNHNPNQRKNWLQAILDSAAEVSHLAKAVRTSTRTMRTVADLFLYPNLPTQSACPMDEQQVKLRRAVANLLIVSTSFVDLTNIERGTFELESVDFDPIALVQQSLESVRPRLMTNGIRLTSQFSSRIPALLSGDPIRLLQILANLLENLINFAEAGEISFSVDADVSSDCHLHFRMAASGAGIPDDLALDVCRTLLQHMGGSLRWGSNPGAATTDDKKCSHSSSFEFDVMLAPATEALTQSSAENTQDGRLAKRPAGGCGEFAQPAARSRGLRSSRILIAEDSDDSRFLLQEFLRSEKYEVIFAENGLQAVECALSLPFDLILMDIQMPVMDGLTATRLIREAERKCGRAATPVLALTGHTRKADIELSLAVGCNAHISKPVSKQVLLNAIRTHLPIACGSQAAPDVCIPAGFEEAAQRYLMAKKNDIPRLLSLVRAKDFELLRRVSHDMKGTGTSFGFPDMTRLGQLMECSAKEQDDVGLSVQLLELSRYVAAAAELLANQQTPVAAF